ncbi:MAG: 2-amino-4-hydroxy-6-hydroxymethyldihydropteridine diphosphokinase [Granulosicoccus sp.]
MKTARVYVAIGSNLGDRAAHIGKACEDISALAGCRDFRCSSIYETDPMGPQNQPDYLNAVCEFYYSGTAFDLLELLQAIEKAHGREQVSERWTARPLDLDIVLFGDLQIREPQLTVPHAGLANRSFVLWPLEELDPSLLIPGLGAVTELIAHCEHLGIRPFDRSAKRI